MDYLLKNLFPFTFLFSFWLSERVSFTQSKKQPFFFFLSEMKNKEMRSETEGTEHHKLPFA